MTNSLKPFYVLVITRGWSEDCYEMAYSTEDDVKRHLEGKDYELCQPMAIEPYDLIAIID